MHSWGHAMLEYGMTDQTRFYVTRIKSGALKAKKLTQQNTISKHKQSVLFKINVNELVM